MPTTFGHKTGSRRNWMKNKKAVEQLFLENDTI